MPTSPDLIPLSDSATERSASRAGMGYYRFRFWARRYWWVVALTVMVGLGIMDILCLRDVPQYASVSQMEVVGRIALPQSQMYNDSLNLVTFFGTQVANMKSAQTVQQAIDRVTTMHPEITVDPEAELDAWVEPRTAIFDLKVVSNNPDYAKVLLDEVMDTYLSSKREMKNQTTDVAVAAITEEIDKLEADIAKDEQDLLNFQKTNNVVFIEEQSGAAAALLVSLNGELARLTKEHDLLTLERNDPLITATEKTPLTSGGRMEVDPAIEAALPGNANDANPDIILAQQDRIEKLKIVRDQYGEYLKDAHPKMIQLAEDIANQEKYLETLKSRGKTARDARREDLELQMQNLEKQITTQRDNSLKLSELFATYQELKNKHIRHEALYNQLKATIQNFDVNKSVDQEDVAIKTASSPGGWLRITISFVSSTDSRAGRWRGA